MGHLFRTLSSLFTAAVLLLSAAAEAGETLDRVIENRTLVVGTSGDQPPLTAVNRQGQLMGIDIDMARALGQMLQVDVTLRQMPFGELMEALDEGRVDVVISGLAITPERARSVAFVGPYMLSGKSIVAREAAITQFAEGTLRGADVKLAALKGSTSADFARKAAPNATLVEVDETAAAIEMLIAGDAAGFVADEPTCKLAVLRNPDAGLVTLDAPLTIEPMGIAVDADDPAFAGLVQNYVNALERTGMLDAVRSKWLENSSWVAALP